jgi:hypothetical protein
MCQIREREARRDVTCKAEAGLHRFGVLFGGDVALDG